MLYQHHASLTARRKHEWWASKSKTCQQAVCASSQSDRPAPGVTWYIAKLTTQKCGEYLSLYVIIDLFSRYIVAWMLSRKEDSALSSQLIEQAYERYGIEPSILTLHQDRGAPMTARCHLDLLGELVITGRLWRKETSQRGSWMSIKSCEVHTALAVVEYCSGGNRCNYWWFKIYQSCNWCEPNYIETRKWQSL